MKDEEIKNEKSKDEEIHYIVDIDDTEESEDEEKRRIIKMEKLKF